ncbi:MAG: hypothetical protein EKK49_15200 [Rhodocyclaceae bacterium]|nr:MAG: hypothetical protein EKK49_15200 [Rhodocyclaceae bacterium]
MMRHKQLEHRFVENLPEKLEPGILYVSMAYATAAHRCCCGCGEEVVTPFTPTDWSMTFDGDTISLSPSVGNWQQPCRSHYVVKRGRVIEASPWSPEQVTAEQARDRAAKARFYDTPEQKPPVVPPLVPTHASPGLLGRIKRFFGMGR